MAAIKDNKYMRKAITLAEKSVANGGGPFGAVIVKDGKVIAQASNTVTLKNDPTAHAEVNAIRIACKKMKTFDLSGCIVYTSCEPCPMCLSAIYWAHISQIFYGCTKEDAKKIGFDDSFIYDEINIAPARRKISAEILLNEEALSAFKLWDQKVDKIEY